MVANRCRRQLGSVHLSGRAYRLVLDGAWLESGSQAVGRRLTVKKVCIAVEPLAAALGPKLLLCHHSALDPLGAGFPA